MAQYVGLEPTSLSASCIQSSALTIRMYCMNRQVAYHHFCIGVNYLVTVRRLTSNIVDGLPWRDMQDLNLRPSGCLRISSPSFNNLL